MKIITPYPPTANLYWRHARGRTFLSAAAKAFKTEVRKRLEAAFVTPQEGPLALHVHVYRPRRVGDLDNTLKVLGDALNGAAWHDDKQVVEIHAYRHDDKDNPRAEVEVLAIDYRPPRGPGVDAPAQAAETFAPPLVVEVDAERPLRVVREPGVGSVRRKP